MKEIWIICAVLFLDTVALKAQTNQPSAVSEGAFYVITDKTLYTPGETIWFAGYLINNGTTTPGIAPDLLSIGLIRQDTTAFSIQKNYLVSNNFCSGSLTLPQNFSPGSYELVAALNLVNRKGTPVYQFRKRSTVRSPQLPAFSLSFQLDTVSAKDSIRISVRAEQSGQTSTTGNNAFITYRLPGAIIQKRKLAISGNAVITLPVTAIDPARPVLYTNTTVGNTNRPFSIRLPVKSSFFAHVPKTDPLVTNGTYDIMLSLSNPIADDTLAIVISAAKPAAITMAFQNQHSPLIETSQTVLVNGSKRVILPLQGFPRGIYSIMLFNEKRERVAAGQFFAHYQNRNNLVITTSKDHYGMHEKVTASLSLTDTSGQPATGVFTVRCVSIARMEKQNSQTMAGYYYQVPLETTADTGIRPSLSKVALSRELRSTPNALREPFKKPLADTLIKPLIQGRVVQATDNRPVKKPLSLLIRQGQQVNLMTTDSAGNFYPEVQQLAVEEGASFMIKAGSSTKYSNGVSYAITINNPMLEAMRQLQEPKLIDTATDLTNQSDKELLLKNKYEGNLLREVTIKGKSSALRPDIFYGGNNCGDFIGPCGYLNCPVHIGDSRNTAPVVGHIYEYRDLVSPKITKVLYQGCTENSLSMVYKGRQFNGAGDKTFQTTGELNYLSTLYWLPSLSLTGSAQVTFYTSDLPGNYKIILEGMADNGDLIYQEKYIKVDEQR